MAEFNLTGEERGQLRRLVAAADEANDDEFHYFENTQAQQCQFPSRGSAVISVKCTRASLENMAAERLVNLRPISASDTHLVGGKLTQLGRDAVKHNFTKADPAPISYTGVVIQGDARGSQIQGAVGDGNTLQTSTAIDKADTAKAVADLAAVTSQLIGILRQVLSADDVSIVAADATMLETELAKEQPSAPLIAAKAGHVVSRILDGVSKLGGAADGAIKLSKAMHVAVPWFGQVLHTLARLGS